MHFCSAPTLEKRPPSPVPLRPGSVRCSGVSALARRPRGGLAVRGRDQEVAVPVRGAGAAPAGSWRRSRKTSEDGDPLQCLRRTGVQVRAPKLGHLSRRELHQTNGTKNSKRMFHNVGRRCGNRDLPNLVQMTQRAQGRCWIRTRAQRKHKGHAERGPLEFELETGGGREEECRARTSDRPRNDAKR